MSRGRHRRRHRAPGRWIAATAAVALAGLTWGTSTTFSGWVAGSVTNGTDSAAMGTLAVTHAYTGGPCVGGPRMSTVPCAVALAPATSPAGTLSDSITNNSGAAITQSLAASSCAPVRFLNNQQASDPLMPRNAVAFQQADPWGSATAAGFSGSGYATDLVGTSGSGLLGLLSNSYSIGVWFKASDAQGGGLISLDASYSNATSATGNPMVWLDTTGHVSFSANGTLGLNVTGTSPAAYSSGWHLVVLTVDTTGVITLTKTVSLYVDGALVKSASGLTLLTSTTGIWHLGWADFTNLTAPTSAYFHGTLAGGFVNQSAVLTAGQVSTLYASASATAYRTSLAGIGGTASIWMLGDDGITTYAGVLPSPMTDPCGQVNVALAFTNPTASVASMTLNAFVSGGSRSIAAPAAGATQSLTVSTSKAGGYSNDIAGLHLYVPLTFTYGTSPATAWTMAMQWSGDPRDVFLG
ncbi:LamG-like jellyroll fold domain-containing protein [Nocardioides ultimimeridianus]